MIKLHVATENNYKNNVDAKMTLNARFHSLFWCFFVWNLFVYTKYMKKIMRQITINKNIRKDTQKIDYHCHFDWLIFFFISFRSFWRKKICWISELAIKKKRRKFWITLSEIVTQCSEQLTIWCFFLLHFNCIISSWCCFSW